MPSNLADARQALAAIAKRFRNAKTSAARHRLALCNKAYVEAVVHELDHISAYMYKVYHGNIMRGSFRRAIRRDTTALKARAARECN